MGPLSGIRVVEFAGLGPGPMAAMLLADLGAEIVRIERPGGGGPVGLPDPVMRNRTAVELDLKCPAGVADAFALIDRAEALIEGYRPGVMEALGLGPEPCLARNPRLVYARMTGWGQEGPLARKAGHDINYIALTGVLDRIGPAGGPPVVPLNLIGDYAGGALYLALGLVSAVLACRDSGRGQVLDVAMVDGAASLMAKQFGLLAAGLVEPGREQNLLDGGAPFYGVYPCADGRFVAVGAIEPKFYADLLAGLDLDPAAAPPQLDRERWPELRGLLAERFATQPRRAWLDRFAPLDACVTPVLTMEEALADPHLQARGTFFDLNGVPQPAPAPRFGGTPAGRPDADRRLAVADVLAAWQGRAGDGVERPAPIRTRQGRRA